MCETAGTVTGAVQFDTNKLTKTKQNKKHAQTHHTHTHTNQPTTLQTKQTHTHTHKHNTHKHTHTRLYLHLYNFKPTNGTPIKPKAAKQPKQRINTSKQQNQATNQPTLIPQLLRATLQLSLHAINQTNKHTTNKPSRAQLLQSKKSISKKSHQ